jgi:hypothetical protein
MKRLTKKQRADAAIADYRAWVANGCKPMRVTVEQEGHDEATADSKRSVGGRLDR